MVRTKLMRHFARWHIWLGWLVGVPLLMWTVTGLVMVITPIEEVRGSHLRIPSKLEALSADIALPVDIRGTATEMRAVMQDGRPVWFVTDADGSVTRYAADGRQGALPPVEEAGARALVARHIVGGTDPVAMEYFSAQDAPFDFRRPVPTWRATLDDGTRIYVNAQTAEIAAVRTDWWRLFDFMWGLHIMDLETRELDQQSTFNHVILVLFASLGVAGSLLGCILMFRRRKARARAVAR